MNKIRFISIFITILTIVLLVYLNVRHTDFINPINGDLIEKKESIEVIEELGFGKSTYKREYFTYRTDLSNKSIKETYSKSISKMGYDFVCSPAISITKGSVSEDCKTKNNSFPFDHKSDLFFRERTTSFENSIITVKITSDLKGSIVSLEIITLIASQIS